MKLKFLPFTMMTVSAIAMTLVACQTSVPPTQNVPGSSANEQMQGFPGVRGVNLTEEQKTKVQAIQENYRSKIDNILTSEQKDAMSAATQQGQNPRQAMRNLNLSSDQKKQVREVMQSQREEISNILTDEQKQQLQQRRQQKSSS